MEWHIINHRDYIDGPFESFETALREARALGNDTRTDPRLKRRAEDFYIYRPPYDRQEHWQPEYWICTRESAVETGVSEGIFDQRLLETW